MDVKSAFLNGYLEEDVYIEQPKGYKIKDTDDKVYKLYKALYALKQAPRVWNTHLDNYLQNIGFKKCPYEYATYINKNKKREILIVCEYVDDL